MTNALFSTLHLVLTGRVQGVGFRPFVYRLAQDEGLQGQVQNTSQGVEILIQGQETTLHRFMDRLQTELPAVAEITGLESSWLDDQPRLFGFHIQNSTAGHGHNVLISPDIALCADCLAEIWDPSNPRYMYPFTNCTNCGPRFTITGSIPYDRATTSMACFPMCPRCSAEYSDPTDRRFHAQPNACPACGPRLWISGPDGQPMGSGTQALEQAALALSQGRIVAIKGLGGFHLACLASDPQAVGRLRERKNRPSKPLAVMVADENTADRLAHLYLADRSWLTGRVRPIVLVHRRTPGSLAKNLAPDTQNIGLMLPYTPLHEVLLLKLAAVLDHDVPPALVMTSGNAGHEPIALGNREALARLQYIADLFVLHDRDILVRCDDSVLRTLPDRKDPLFYRRARGFVPSPIRLAKKGPSVLGLGPELKTTICLTKDDQAFVSQHIGDVQNIATYDFYQETIEHLQDILQTKPQALVTDLHPDFLTTRYAAEQDKLPVFSLQHHMAHILAVLAENSIQEPCLGLALDGTGLGLDHTLWGGELLCVDAQSMECVRLGHFSPMALPGGDQAIAQPWRTAQSLLYTMGETSPAARDWPWIAEFSPASNVVAQMLEKGIHCIQTTSCGRLFDAVSALLGLCQTIAYEGQAAIRLDQVQGAEPGPAYECPLEHGADSINLNTMHLFTQVYADWLAGKPAAGISHRFHSGLIHGLSRWAEAASRQTGIRRIALSGGVFQNATLAGQLPHTLQNFGLLPITHRFLPPNDACIALGQAVYGRIRLCRG